MWSRLLRLFRRRPLAVDPAVTAYRRFRSMPEPTTDDAIALLIEWEFDPGEEIAVFLVRPARLWRHQMLPEPEWAITLEDGVVLHHWTVTQILAAVTKLAERQEVAL